MVGIAFTGCNSLDLEPISSIADNKYWQTEAQVDAFNVGLHSKFREKCSYSIFLFGEPRADYYFGESTFGSATQGNERMWNNSLNDVNTVVSNFGNLYEVINQANLMINKVEGMSMNESTKKILSGRSLWYPCFPLLSVVTILWRCSDMDRFLGRVELGSWKFSKTSFFCC